MNSTAPILREAPSVGTQPPAYRLPALARVGMAKLAVSQLERSVAFYRDVIGLSVLERAGVTARLGIPVTNTILLELEEAPGVQPISKRSRLGLYHTAFLLPTREALSSFVQHVQAKKISFGAGDHIVSEAFYLTDPDGLTVEVYADRPRSEWIVDGDELRMVADPIRFDELPRVAPDSWQGAPTGTTLGHMHFYVGDLERASEFYHAGLGLAVMTRLPGALFVSAGGYHHHVGLNLWAAGSPQAASTDARLLYWELLLPSAEEVQEAAASLTAGGYLAAPGEAGGTLFTDPWGITVALTVERALTSQSPIANQ